MKAILFDVDGVVLEARTEFFSERFAREQGIPKEEVQGFFLGIFKECSFGRADLKEVVVPFLARWKWQGSVEEFLTHWFESESTKDEAVLEVIATLRSKGILCYIATRQEKYRLQYLLEGIGLKKHFDGAFCTCVIGYDKKEPEFYAYILKELGLAPSEVLFFDDTQANVEMACALGITSYRYEGVESLQEVVAGLSE